MAKKLIIHFPKCLIGSCAAAISLVILSTIAHDFLVFAASAYLLVIVAIDLRCSKIPNWCNGTLLVVALGYHGWVFGLPGLGTAVLGFLVGLALLLIPYLMGGMGGGDVKALAALGALLGPVTILHVFVYIALFGGLFSILHYLFSRNFLENAAGAGRALMAFAGTRDVEVLRPATTEKLRFPYASAIAFGFYSYVQWGDIFTLLRSL